MKYSYLLFCFVLTACFSLQKNTFGTTEEADLFANKVMKATHQEKWATTEVIQWTFDAGNHVHIWDKKREYEYVRFGDYEVWMSLNTKKGVVKKNGVEVTTDKQEYLDKAYSFWINDSFWLNPIAKFYDQGTKRSLVEYKNDTTLLVSYEQGGETPGDSYLWLVDDNYRPKAWKLWVSIIPVKGMEFSFDNWQQMESGVLIATEHKGSLLNINLSDVKAVNNLTDLFDKEDPFAILELKK